MPNEQTTDTMHPLRLNPGALAIPRAPEDGRLTKEFAHNALADFLRQWEGSDILDPDTIYDIASHVKEQRSEERIEAASRREMPTNWQNAYCDDPRAAGVYAADANKGLLLSLINLGRVDIEFIAQTSGLTCPQVVEDLGDAIWQNPETWQGYYHLGWETSDQYLSGQLLPKLHAAREAAEKWPEIFERNVAALEAVMPKAVRFGAKKRIVQNHAISKTGLGGWGVG